MLNNKSVFKGRLTKDGAYQVTGTGKPIYKLSIAVDNGKPKFENDQPVINPQTKRQEYTDDAIFIDVTAFGKVAESIVNGSLHPALAKGAYV